MNNSGSTYLGKTFERDLLDALDRIFDGSGISLIRPKSLSSFKWPEDGKLWREGRGEVMEKRRKRNVRYMSGEPGLITLDGPPYLTPDGYLLGQNLNIPIEIKLLGKHVGRDGRNLNETAEAKMITVGSYIGKPLVTLTEPGRVEDMGSPLPTKVLLLTSRKLRKKNNYPVHPIGIENLERILEHIPTKALSLKKTELRNRIRIEKTNLKKYRI